MASRWLKALGEVGGPLLGPALAFDATHGPFDQGAEGLRRLARVLEDAEPESEEEDRRLVEGAGAVLALLLVGARGGRHAPVDDRHGVQLGERGWFDGFEAVEAVLDADDPRAELARQVARAEAEADGHGPVARVQGAFDAALRARRPQRRIDKRTGLHVTLDDGTEVDLERVARVAAGDDSPDTLTAAAERLVEMLPGGRGGGVALPFESARDRLLPRLVGDAFLANLEGGEGLCTEPLGHDVHVALVAAFEGRARYVRVDEVEAWGLGAAGARQLALRNLAARSEDARFAHVQTAHGALVVARSGDGLDAARLLLPGLHEVLARELGGRVVASVPHRDTLLAASGDAPDALDELRRRTADAAARAPHRISDRLFEVRPDGPRPWSAPGTAGR